MCEFCWTRTMIYVEQKTKKNLRKIQCKISETWRLFGRYAIWISFGLLLSINSIYSCALKRYYMRFPTNHLQYISSASNGGCSIRLRASVISASPTKWDERKIPGGGQRKRLRNICYRSATYRSTLKRSRKKKKKPSQSVIGGPSVRNL